MDRPGPVRPSPATPADGTAVLVVGRDGEETRATRRDLDRAGATLSIRSETDPGSAVDRAGAADCAVVVDEGGGGLDLVERVRAAHPDMPVVLYTDGGAGVASDALDRGATDSCRRVDGAAPLLVRRIENAVKRRRAERAAGATERFHRALAAGAADAVLVVDADRRVRYATPATRHVLGWSPRALVDADEGGGDAAGEAVGVDRVFESLAETDRDDGVTFPYDHPDGDRRWLEARGRDLRDDDDVEGIVVYLRDVTDREERARRLATLVDNLPGVVYRCRTERGWPMALVHGACEALTGYQAAELEAGDVTWEGDLIHPDDRDRVREAVTTAVDAGEPYETTYRIQTRDGGRRWVWERGQAVDDGHLEGFVTDVSDREFGRYAAIVENMDEGVFLFDESARVQFVNDRVTDATDTTADQWLGEPIGVLSDLGLLSAEEVDRVESLVLACHRGERDGVRTELEPERPAHIDALELRLVAHRDDGEVLSVLGTTRDVTDRKRRERQLRRQNERLDEFASVVSHDLRNPLSVANARLNLARGRADEGDVEGLRDHLDAVEAAHDRMDELVGDVLSLSRQGEAVVELEPVRLDDAARACWSQVVTDDARLSIESDVVVDADPSRLRQLLENLFRNSVEHGADGDGRVEVRVGGTADGFFVADDGDGFPEDDVFDAGFSTAPDGTGYGLSIVREIARAHGWTVSTTDAAGGGARVDVSDVTVRPEAQSERAPE
ncbi:MAG: PAS domain S-box protein [Halobacteriaceae archaeon]